MDLTQSYIECHKALRERANGKSLRALAAELGYPPCKAAMLSHVLSGSPVKARHVSRRTLVDLRLRLQIEHKRKRKNISLSPEAFEKAKERMQAEHLTWDELVRR